MTKAIKQIVLHLLIVLLLLQACPTFAYENVFSCVEKHQEIYFSDVAAMGSGYWATEAIYQLSSFGLLQGFGEGQFRPTQNVTRVQALAILFRARNREQQAELMAEEIDKTRKQYPDSVTSAKEWSDGYIGLALGEGLITMAQYKDALSASPTDFYKNEAATRQEIAYWIAAAFGIAPSYDNSLTNAYYDSDAIEFEYRPYLNALVNEKIMVGSDNRLRPTSALTRAEMAQILLNCDNDIVNRLGFAAMNGVVTNIPSRNVIEIGDDVIVLDTAKEEGVTVVANNRLGSLSLLQPNDEVTYYLDSESRVFFVKAKTNTKTVTTENKITSGIVKSINSKTITLYDESGKTDSSLLRSFNISSKVTVRNNNQTASIYDIAANDNVFLKVANGYVAEISFSKQTTNDTTQTTVSYVDKIYKAQISSFETLTKSLFVKDVLELNGSSWDYTEHKGVLELKVDSATKLYYGNAIISYSDIASYKGKEVMLALSPKTDTKERIAFLRISEDGTTTVYQDKLSTVSTGNRKVTLAKAYKEFSVDSGTIIVKDGKLVTINQLSKSDPVSVAARSTSTKNQAYVLVVDEQLISDGIRMYYTRIEEMANTNQLHVTVYREYDANDRDVIYSKKSITVKLTNNTRYYDENGMINNRDFNLWANNGDYIYANIVVKDGEAFIISLGTTAYEIATAKVGSIIKSGTKTEGLNLYRIWRYLKGKFSNNLDDGPMYIANNTIILKNNKSVQASEIKAGNTITVFYADEYADDEETIEQRRAKIIIIN